MSFRDVFKKSFLEGYSSTELGTKEIIVALLIAFVLGLYIYLCYRMMTRKTFYNKSFALSLVGMSMITAAIILTIQSSLVVSLGMVGALSIVRFRTAIKDPMDLVYLYWSISMGIICGAGLAEIAILLSIALTIVIVALDHIPVGQAPMVLVITATRGDNTIPEIEAAIKQSAPYYEAKTKAVQGDTLNLVYELRVKDSNALVDALAARSDVVSVSLLAHNGEVTY